MKIVIAEENLVTSKKIRNVLEQLNHTVLDEADNGFKAYNKFIEHKPDIILMSLSLPLLDGMNTLQKIKDYDSDASVVILCFENQRKIVFEAIERGASHYLTKPFDELDVMNVLNELIEMKDGVTECIK